MLALHGHREAGHHVLMSVVTDVVINICIHIEHYTLMTQYLSTLIKICYYLFFIKLIAFNKIKNLFTVHLRRSFSYSFERTQLIDT